MNALDQLSSLSDAALDNHIVRLAANERTSTVDLLVSLVALKRRHDAAGLGFKLWTYCHQRLQMVESTASRYTSAVKLLAQFPSAEPFLRDGRLNPTTFTALQDVLTDANHQELFQRASGLSQREIDILLAELQPKPDVEESMRFVPDRTPRPTKPTSVAEVERREMPAPVPESQRSPDLFERAQTSAAEVERGHNLTAVATVTTGDFTSLLPKDLPPSRCKAKLKPLRKGHYVLEINCDQQFADELEDLRMALTHIFPKADLGDAIREAVRRTLKDVQRRKYGLCSSKKVEPSEELGSSLVKVAPCKTKGSRSSPSPKEKLAATSVAEVDSLGTRATSSPTPMRSGTSVTEVQTLASQSPTPMRSGTSVAEVGTLGSLASSNPMRSGTSVTEVGTLASLASPNPIRSGTSVTEVQTLASQSPSPMGSGTSVTEVGPLDSQTSKSPMRSGTSVTEVETPGSLASSTAMRSGTSVTEVGLNESTTSLPTVSRTSVTEVAHGSSLPSTSTTEVPRPSDSADLNIPPALFNAFNMQTDGAQFIPPWLRTVRSLPAEVKRAVYERDGGSCAFIGSTGHRCGSRYRLEYDHWVPYAQGGEPTVDQIRLLCRHHNIYFAFQTFGVELMSRYVRVY